jgi:hypothetical protein
MKLLSNNNRKIASFCIDTSRRKGNMYLGPSTKYGMIGYNHPLRYICSQNHVLGHVAHMKVTIIACVYLFYL